MTTSRKEFGKLTATQFAELIQYIPVLLSLIGELGIHMSKLPASRFDAVMDGTYGNYSHVYEETFSRHLAIVSVAVNRHGDIHSIAQAADPTEEVLKTLRNLNNVEDDCSLHEAFDGSMAMALIYSLGQTITSMATYGRSISALLQEARERNDLDSLFKAVRMDRTVIATPTAMQLIARAQLRSDEAFFTRFRSSLGGPGRKQWQGLHPMRYAFVLLNEMGIHDLSDAQLESLMVDTLKVYPKSPTARKNLRAQYQQYRKYTTI